MIGNVSEREARLEEFVKRLEEEMRKIDAFKRELPLCMNLLIDAIRHLKDEEPIQCSSKNELWNTDDYPFTDCTKQNPKLDTKKNEEKNGLGSEDPFQSCRDRSGGRGFLPFKACPGFPLANKEEKEELPVDGLSLLTPGIKNLREESGANGLRTSSSRVVSSSAPNANIRSGSQQQQQQSSRKQRRCWSPELHRRFVSALQQLGGSQAATPKQIRELMQVDGLTNDEVKSHLQKYRLHTRRLPATGAASPANQSVVVLGGLWMPQDQYGESSKACNSQSGSPQGPLQLTGNTGGTSTTGGDSMEDDEDANLRAIAGKSHIQKPGKLMYRVHPP
ncbi:hypothetical protein SLA2020_441630 [Shorea laevis]